MTGKMITSLAKSRLRYNKSRTVLTVIAVMLTTTLLMALGTSAFGLLDFNKQQAAANSNIHATLKGVSDSQLTKLSNHADIESMETSEIFATVEYEKMNGFLTYSDEVKDGIYHGVGNLIQGDYAEKADEICGPKVFFKRMGVENPKVGEKINIPFRVMGKGEIQQKEFVISGFVSELDISKMNVSDSRIAYSANISEELIEQYLSKGDRTYNVSLRVSGETKLDYEQMESKINKIADDIGLDKENVSLNKEYLVVMTDPGTDTLRVVIGVALLIIIFSGIVIYSIYYVGVITDVHETGKLKALGATKKQIKKLLRREGAFVAGISIPLGLVLGYLIPYFLLPSVLKKGLENNVTAFEIKDIHMFSVPVIIIVAAVVILTVYISMFKPVRMASKISPVEAMRYQESSKGKKVRKGNKEINVFRLSKANLTRNKKRTAVTMITMGLSCVLFMSMAGALNSMSAEDIAGRNVGDSDFKLYIDYDLNDEAYPENNLENIQKNKPMGDDFVEKIEAIDGVEKVKTVDTAAISSDYPCELFADGNKVTIGSFTREEAKEYSKEVKRGELDYDKMVRENGAIFTSDVFLDEYNLEIGNDIGLSVYDGDEQKPFDINLQASVDSGSDEYFIVPEEVFNSIDLKEETTSAVYIDVDKDKYQDVKESLENVVDSNEFFKMYSRDEELEIGAMSVNIIKYPMYAILFMIAVIGFMNLINTMITSIITRKRELGMLQAIGLTGKQMTKMLAGEGLVFTIGTLIASLSLGNLFGYLVYLWAEKTGFMSVTAYHYPAWETLGLVIFLIAGQMAITLLIGKRLKRESVIERIRSGE